MLVNTETHIDCFIDGIHTSTKRSPVALALSSYVSHKVLSGLPSSSWTTPDHSQTAFQIYATLRTNRLHQVVRQCEGDLC